MRYRTTTALLGLDRTAWALGVLSIFAVSSGAQGLAPEVLQNHSGNAEHVDQADLNLLNATDSLAAFELAFEAGDELFEAEFNAIDGGGANVGGGERFTRVPRPDLTGPGEWANHIPTRATGPNSATCVSCHNKPAPDGAGEASSNVHRDPLHQGIGSFINRSTPILFGLGPAQRLAEEMTDELQATRAALIAQASETGRVAQSRLYAKGVYFGLLRVNPSGVVVTTKVEGVDADLVVRPLQWKGAVESVRAFNRDASHQELGMQAVELVGHGVDGDFDGVVDEMTVGDQTALAVYIAGQPRPVTNRELADAGVIPELSLQDLVSIEDGAMLFKTVGCADCHTPSMTLYDPVYSEPSLNANYRDAVFPSGLSPIAEGLDPATAIQFDMTTDLLDNIIDDGAGGVVHLGNLESDGTGGGIVRMFTDLKRHDLGAELAEQIDETGTGKSMFLTEALWGVGSTAPYLHDGRATTLTEAILYHGGEGAASRAAFKALSAESQAAMIAFMDDMVIFLDGE